MKLFYAIIVILLSTPFLTYSKIDVEQVIEDFSVIQNTGNAGREFWVTAVPINGFAHTPDSTDIYIFSTVKTKVDISVEGKNFSRSFNVEPNKINRVRLDSNIIYPLMLGFSKVKDAEVYKKRAVHIQSQFPIIVYVFNKDIYHLDGYFAIPTFASSNKYVNMAYTSSNYGNVLYPCYTSVISQYDNTNVKITVGGGKYKDDEIEFEDGRKVKTGELTTQLMDRGDILLLSANDNLQDISGSLIESDKPITILSGIPNAKIPINIGEADLLTNMEFPTNLCGKNYLFTPLKNRLSPGFFRAFATEDNTNVYRNGELMGNIKKGGGADYGESYLEFNSWMTMDNVKPVAITSDKPIALSYYNSFEQDRGSSYYDNESHMFQLPSIEQGVKSAIHSTPDAIAEIFTKDFFNHIVITFPLINEKIPTDIEMFIFDSLGVKTTSLLLSEEYEDILKVFDERIEGKTYGSVTIELKRDRMYHLKSSNTKFVCYSYGADLNNGYSLPSGFSLYERNTNDSLPPIVYYEQDCNGNINSETATITDMPTNEENRSNLADIYMMAGENYTFGWNAPNNDFMSGVTQTVNWSLKVIDKKKSSSALLYAVDRAGNDTIIYIESQPSAELEIISSDNEIRNPKFKTYSFQDTIKNQSSFQSLYITRVELSGMNSKFTIDSFEPGNWQPGIPIPPNQERYINYTFTHEEIKDDQVYSDSVYVGIGVNNGNEITECSFKPFSEVTVKTKYPEYSVITGNDFGKFGKDPKITKMLDTIRNESATIPLYLSRIELKDGNNGFQINGYSPTNWNISKAIEPQSEIVVNIFFNPLDFDQTTQDQILIDSLGVGVLGYNKENELEEVIFDYKSEQKAVIIAKDPESSVDDEKELREYIKITDTEIQLLPRTSIEGFYELSIYDIKGNQLMNTDIKNQKSISISNLQSGTYIITLKSEDRILTQKMGIVR